MYTHTCTYAHKQRASMHTVTHMHTYPHKHIFMYKQTRTRMNIPNA